MAVGLLIGVWIASGVVPLLIYYGLEILAPSYFLAAACVACAVVSLATGSSWSTAATAGLALIGVGTRVGGFGSDDRRRGGLRRLLWRQAFPAVRHYESRLRHGGLRAVRAYSPHAIHHAAGLGDRASRLPRARLGRQRFRVRAKRALPPDHHRARDGFRSLPLAAVSAGYCARPHRTANRSTAIPARRNRCRSRSLARLPTAECTGRHGVRPERALRGLSKQHRHRRRGRAALAGRAHEHARYHCTHLVRVRLWRRHGMHRHARPA